MIIGIGTDIVVISRIQRLYELHGNRFLCRIFTERERRECLGRKQPGGALALRWAAKEAVMKALGTGYREGVTFHDIEVYHHPTGKPDLRFTGPTAERARRMGVSGSFVTLSHDGDLAIAVVVLEGNGGG